MGRVLGTFYESSQKKISTRWGGEGIEKLGDGEDVYIFLPPPTNFLTFGN